MTAQQLVSRFPTIFDQAVADLAKYKLARERGLIKTEQQQLVEAWFYDFPRLWSTIQPNWQWNADGTPATGERLKFAETVNRFVIRLRGENFQPSLGIAPLLIAGILVAGAFGAAGLTWALGYVRDQANISAMIDGVLAGKLPPEVLADAVKEQRQGVFGEIKDVALLVLLGGLAFFLLPRLFPQPKYTRAERGLGY